MATFGDMLAKAIQTANLLTEFVTYISTASLNLDRSLLSEIRL